MTQSAPEYVNRPQVDSDETVVAPANGGDRQRTPNEVSQPAQLNRPLEESARLANEVDSRTLLGVEYEVTREGGHRRV